MSTTQHKYIAAWDEFTHVRPERREINQQNAAKLHAPEKAVFLTVDNRWVTYDDLGSDENKRQLMDTYEKLFGAKAKDS